MWVFQRPKWVSIFLMTGRCSIKAITFISPLHFGQVNGPVSYIFWIRRAQFFRNDFHVLDYGITDLAFGLEHLL